MNAPLSFALAVALVASAAQVAAQPVGAGPYEHPPELARVVSVTPNLVRVEDTRQECSTELREVRGGGTEGFAGSMVGALTGAALGSLVGKGTGQLIAASAGASVGAGVGRQMAAGAPRTESVQVCRGVPVVREAVRDYTVRYEWNGRVHATLMTAHPGEFVRVNATHRATSL
jgi:uncharacterized protein YcfJ